MKRCRKMTAYPAFLVAALLLGGGCSTFRSMFDEDPAVTKQKREQAKKKKDAKEAKEAKACSSEDSGVFPTLFPKKEKEHEPVFSSSLSPEERAILKKTQAEAKQLESGNEVDQIRRENRERSNKLSESVFGGGLSDLF